MKRALIFFWMLAATIAFARDKKPVASDGASPLVSASVSGNIEAVRDLIQKGADVNGCDTRGNFPLYAAVSGDHADVVELLIKNGANVNQAKAGNVLPEMERNTTALHAASVVGNQAVVELLVDASADVNAFANLNEQNAKVFKNMLENQEYLKLINSDAVAYFRAHLGEIGVTPLTQASKFGHADIVALLLDHGADLNFQKPGNNTALIEAAIAGRQDVVELLVRRKADLNRVGEEGGTALALALYHEQYDSAKALLTAGAAFQLGEQRPSQPGRLFAWGAYQFLVAEKLRSDSRNTEAKKMLTDALASLLAARDDINKWADYANKSAKRAKSDAGWASVASVAFTASDAITPALTNLSSRSSQRQMTQMIALRNSKTPEQYFANFEELERGNQPGIPLTSAGAGQIGNEPFSSSSAAKSIHDSAESLRNSAQLLSNSARLLRERAAACDDLIQRATKNLNDLSGK
jgi:ankyrin repeat protein